MEKKSTITKVTGNGTWNSPNGLMYKWEVEMANGEAGNCMTKSPQPDKWMVGKEVTYTKEVKGQYTNFKLVQEKPDLKASGKFEPKDSALIVAQTCIKGACEVLAQSSAGMDKSKVKEMAEELFVWAMSKATIKQA